MEVAGVPTEHPVVWDLVLLLHRFDRARRLLEQQAQLGAADQRLMWLLSDGRPRTLREISEQLGLEQSTVNRQVNAALKSGLVERSREAGQSASLISATGDGLTRFAHDRALNLDTYAEALTAVGEPGDQASFVARLGGFVRSYEISSARHGQGGS